MIIDMQNFFLGGGGGGGKQGALCENGEWQFIPAVRHFYITYCVLKLLLWPAAELSRA